MRRYYSHYTYIYPDVYLANHIVELDSKQEISSYYPFEKEIEKTEFYSGLIVFLPKFVNVDESLIEQIKSEVKRKYLIDDISEISIIEITCNQRND